MRTPVSFGNDRPRRRAALCLGAFAVAAMLLHAATTARSQTLHLDLVDRSALRVCADPANMPFTNEAGEGFENKIAELLADDLGLPLEYTWFPQATGFYRMTLGAKRCDVVMGFVASGDPMLNTNPYYTSAWVLVSKKGGPLDGVETLEDPRLKDRHLGIVAGTPPATIFAMRGLMMQAKPYPLVVDRRYEDPASDMIADLVAGKIDGGILWGPIAGYLVHRASADLSLMPLVREREGPPLVFRITMGIRAGELDWKHRLNDFLAKHHKDIVQILLDYDVPLLDERNNRLTKIE